jgi:hypothetical protein
MSWYWVTAYSIYLFTLTRITLVFFLSLPLPPAPPTITYFTHMEFPRKGFASRWGPEWNTALVILQFRPACWLRPLTTTPPTHQDYCIFIFKNVMWKLEIKYYTLKAEPDKIIYTFLRSSSLNLFVSLPRGRIQEIKRMTLVNFTHGLFLTCTQKSCYIYKSFIAIFTKCTTFPSKSTPYISDKTTCFTYLESQHLCSWWEIPIHPCLWSANNCPTHWLLLLAPFHTAQFKLHYLHRWHQQSRSSSSGTLFMCAVAYGFCCFLVPTSTWEISFFFAVLKTFTNLLA